MSNIHNHNNDAPLTHHDLSKIDNDMEKALISYLNLPPVGGLADKANSPGLNNSNPYEIPNSPRQALVERRNRIGKFSSLEDIKDINGFAASDLSQITDNLEDLSRHGNRAQPIWGGPDANRAFFELLESATRYIHISTYIVGGESGLKMTKLLARKIKEGVKVRLAFCASGFVLSGSPSGTGFVSGLSEMRSWLLNDMYFRKKIVCELMENNVPFINNAPIGRHWRRRNFKKQGIKTEKAYFKWAEKQGIPNDWIEEQRLIDRECALGFANVDHRKMVIIDGERAFVGSQNISDSYFYENELSESPKVNRKNWQWHDNSTILEGGSVGELNKLFAMRWMLCGGDMYDYQSKFYNPAPTRVGNSIVTTEATIPGGVRLPLSKNWMGFLATFFGFDKRPIIEGTNPIKERLLNLPQFATKDFYVEHCYPCDTSLLSTWVKMGNSVPNFNMVVPNHYDTPFLGAECDRYYPELARAGIQLHGYDRAIMHSKILVMDGYYVATGSYNFTLRSSRADLENAFFIQCENYGQAVKDHIQKDLELCTPIKPSTFDKYRSRRSIPIVDALLRYFLF